MRPAAINGKERSRALTPFVPQGRRDDSNTQMQNKRTRLAESRGRGEPRPYKGWRKPVRCKRSGSLTPFALRANGFGMTAKRRASPLVLQVEKRRPPGG